MLQTAFLVVLAVLVFSENAFAQQPGSPVSEESAVVASGATLEYIATTPATASPLALENSVPIPVVEPAILHEYLPEEEPNSIRKVSITPSGSSITLIRPVEGGRRSRGPHGRWRAIDIAKPRGSPIRAAADGVVERIGNGYERGWRGYGKHIVLRHSGGVRTFYAHNNKNHVKEGDRVMQGQVIAHVGSTGRSTGPHLHFAVIGGKNPF